MRSLLAIVSMLFCVAAGVQLLGIQPAQENSIFGMIAHGLGLYCIGKGLYCAGDLWPRQAVSPALPVATTPPLKLSPVDLDNFFGAAGFGIMQPPASL